jgi:general secretion pathway protein D
MLALAANHIKAQGTNIGEEFQAAIDAKSASFLAGIGLNLLENKGVAETLSEPTILCVNNKTSDIYVGKTISIKTASNTQTTGGTVNSYKRQDVGLELSVKPRISSENQVSLKISVQLENLGSPDGNGQPTTTKSRIKTISIVKNGEPVVLGGMTRTDDSKAQSGVPFLSKIPFLGRLFRNNANSSAKQNLLIIVTPYIVESSGHLSELRKKLIEEEDLKNRYLSKYFNK